MAVKQPIYLEDILYHQHYERLRALPAGTPLLVMVCDDTVLRLGEIVTVVRPLRRPSRRIAVQRTDGTQWDVPMVWVRSMPAAP